MYITYCVVVPFLKIQVSCITDYPTYRRASRKETKKNIGTGYFAGSTGNYSSILSKYTRAWTTKAFSLLKLKHERKHKEGGISKACNLIQGKCK